MQNTQFEEEKDTRKFNAGVKARAGNDKEMRGGLTGIGIKGGPPSGQDHISSQFVERKDLRNFLFLKKASTNDSCCKCDSEKPGSIPSEQPKVTVGSTWR